MTDITVTELKERRDAGEDIFLIDVREEDEYAVSDIGGVLMPLSQFQDFLPNLESRKTEEIVVQCRSGARSGRVCDFLRAQGFENVRNLIGGIQAYAATFNPEMPVA